MWVVFLNNQLSHPPRIHSKTEMDLNRGVCIWIPMWMLHDHWSLSSLCSLSKSKAYTSGAISAVVTSTNCMETGIKGNRGRGGVEVSEEHQDLHDHQQRLEQSSAVSLVLWPWASCLTSLYLDFLICEMEIIEISASQNCVVKLVNIGHGNSS